MSDIADLLLRLDLTRQHLVAAKLPDALAHFDKALEAVEAAVPERAAELVTERPRFDDGPGFTAWCRQIVVAACHGRAVCRRLSPRGMPDRFGVLEHAKAARPIAEGGTARQAWVAAANALGLAPPAPPSANGLARAEAVSTVRAERDAEIRRLYATGAHRDMIADVMGVTPKLVTRVLRERAPGYGISSIDRAKAQYAVEILRRHNAGESGRSIARAMKLSRQIVDGVIREGPAMGMAKALMKRPPTPSSSAPR